ncbi:hypothetical protein Adt_19985 [Abeliophyllum distichum]|uniref:Uncharacterized protein n=1 Tax=Abeliophyllum distichum TaxID=126358 RepID=A0ABD1SUH3_9LAMI
MQLAQDKDELLKYFIARFNRATLGIKDLQMSDVVTAMMSGTQSRSFKMSLSKNPSDTMNELLRREEKQSNFDSNSIFFTKKLKTRAKANNVRLRLMRLSEAAEKLRRQAAVNVQTGKENDARELLFQKKKGMQAMEKSNSRIEVLDKLSAKLNEV